MSTSVSPLAKYKLVRMAAIHLLLICISDRQQSLDHVDVPSQVFLGDQSVGKTSIITRFMYDKFDNTYQVAESTVQLKKVHVIQHCNFAKHPEYLPGPLHAPFVGKVDQNICFGLEHQPLSLPPSSAHNAGHNRNRLPLQDYVLGGQDSQTAALVSESQSITLEQFASQGSVFTK